MQGSSDNSVTELLLRWRDGDTKAQDALIPLIYGELRRIARKCLSGQRPDQTLQPTALVHEAYLRLVQPGSVNWQNRTHFFAVAARMMRQILIDHSRRHAASKRGGGTVMLALEEDLTPDAPRTNLDFIALDRAMSQLAALDARQCQIVELRFFGGLSIEETAQVVEISAATAKREWATARLWLHHAMNGNDRR